MQSPPLRIPQIDIVRGLALFGILIINIQTYSLFAFLRPGQVYSLQLDGPEAYVPLQFIIHFFIKGQFYTIYSFLFGFGFYTMYSNFTSKGLNAGKLMSRRLWILLFFGICHAFFFWFGDVLHKYAILGFSLLWLSKKSIPSLWKWIIALLLCGILLQLAKYFFFPISQAVQDRNIQQMDTVIYKVARTWQTGTFIQVMEMQKLGVLMLDLLAFRNGMISFIHYEMMFILGIIAAKANIFQRAKSYDIGIMKLLCWLMPMAVSLKLISCVPVVDVALVEDAPLNTLLLNLSDLVGTPMLTVVCLITINQAIGKTPSKLAMWIAAAGRLGLTNYLAQTGICMVLFYGYGFGLSGKITLIQSVIVAAAIYVLQVAYSNLWLKYHNLGPMEKLWRRLTLARGGELEL